MSFECLFRMIGKLISESVRFILFFASLLFMLASVVMLLYSSQIRSIYGLIQINDIESSFIAIIALAIYLVGLSAVGIHGTFFRSKSSIEWFSLLAGLNVLICLGVLMYTSPNLADSREAVQNKLEKSQANYDWFHNAEASIEIKEATGMWDTLQSTRQCCGTKSYKDWDGFRPANSSSLYPISCCISVGDGQGLKDKPCNNEEDIWPLGCFKIISASVSSISILLSALTWTNLLLSIMACFVIFFQPKSQYYDYS